MVTVGNALSQPVRTSQLHQRPLYKRFTNQLTTAAAKMVKVVYGYSATTLTIFLCHSLQNAFILPLQAVPIQTAT